MNDVDIFQNVLKYRTFFKLVSQVSWDIAQLEKRHPLEAANNDELNSIAKAYEEYHKMLKGAVDTIWK